MLVVLGCHLLDATAKRIVGEAHGPAIAWQCNIDQPVLEIPSVLHGARAVRL